MQELCCRAAINMQVVPDSQVESSLHFIAKLPKLELVDLRGTHVEESLCWSHKKCVTMQHASALMKALRRRQTHAHVLLDLWEAHR